MSEFGKILGKERMMYKTSEEERKEKKWERDRKRMREIRLNMPEQEKAVVSESTSWEEASTYGTSTFCQGRRRRLNKTKRVTE